MSNKSTIVVSVGGSLIVPDEIDTTFLKNLKRIILEEIRLGKRFIIITGGGKTARNYQQAADKVTTLTDEDLDWLGIHATRLNAHLLRAIFYKNAHPVIITNPKGDRLPQNKPILIAAGFRPGASTDLRAVELAERLGAQKLVNLSNIDYAYENNPRKFKNAKPIKETDWASFRKLLPQRWNPGLSAPFDPVAAKLAQNLNVEVAIINGKKLSQFKNYLADKPFIGTRIKG